MKDRNTSRADRHGLWLDLAMVVLMIAAFGWLAFGPGFAFATSGIGALLAFPFAIGALYARRMYTADDYPLTGCLIIPVALLVAILAIVWLGGFEGLICIAMILPLWIVGGAGGAFAVYLLKYTAGGSDGDSGGARLNSVGLALVPFVVIWAEMAAPAPWKDRIVSRSIDIDAPPSEIWPYLVEIPDIAENEGRRTFTHDLLGVARPREARLVHRAGLLVRKARWGRDIRFEEIVTKVVPGRSIAWRFAFPDDSIQRYTDRHIAPDGPILKLVGGGYDLHPRENGSTRVILSTHYRMRSRLGWYLGWWGERVLGDIEENVLAIIRDRSGSVIDKSS